MIPAHEKAFELLDVDTSNEFVDLMTECVNKTATFAKTFFPGIFFRPFSQLHYELCAILDGDKQQVAIAAPRGFGKTSLFTLAYPAKRILFRDSQHIIPISSTADASVEQSENLKSELIDNERVQAVFGEMHPTSHKDSFGQKGWVTRYGCMVRPRGAGQAIRGRNVRGKRPDLYPIDDLENDEAVESTEQRHKLRNWLFSAVMNSVDRGLDTWRVMLIGTILHEDSLLANLLRDPHWYSVRLELCNEKYESNWPDFMTTEQVKKLAAEYRDRGLLRLFYQEYRNISTAVEEQGFKEEMFRHYTETHDFWEREGVKRADLETVVLGDIARTMGKGATKSALAVITIDRKRGKLYGRDLVSGRFSPDMFIKTMFDLAEKYDAFVLAPEVTGLHEYAMWPIRNEMARRRSHYILVEVKPRESKTGPKRSGGLIPLYRQGLIWHSEAFGGAIEPYLMQWPRPESWDEIDAFSGIIYAMEDGERYLGLYENEEEEDAETVEAEYDDLDYSSDELVPAGSMQIV